MFVEKSHVLVLLHLGGTALKKAEELTLIAGTAENHIDRPLLGKLESRLFITIIIVIVWACVCVCVCAIVQVRNLESVGCWVRAKQQL